MAEKKPDVSKPEEELPALSYQIQSNIYGETFGDKFARKTKQNPFVPLGLLLTVVALVRGLYSFQRGDKELSQKMMRYRVGAQGFTMFAVLAGVWYSSLQKNPVEPESTPSKS